MPTKAGNAKIGKRDTKHGRMDLPVASLDKYSGFKKGGIMRKGKRFEEGGVTEGPNAGISDETRARAMEFVRKQQEGGSSQPAAAPRATPRPAAKAAPKEDDSDAVSRNTSRKSSTSSAPAAKAAPKEDDSDAVSRNTSRKSFTSSAPAASKAEDTGRYIGYRASSRALGSRTPEEKEAASERMGEVLGTAASLTPMGRGVGAAKTAYSGARSAADAATQAAFQRRNKSGLDAMKEAQRKADYGGKLEPTGNVGLKSKTPEKLNTRGKPETDIEFSKGGNVKESKAMVNKEVDFFKKKGAPKSMIKHEAAEAKEMRFAKGGSIMRPKKAIAADQMKMAPYAKGGGVELRGKTQGKTIKMATGGAVKFSRGGGIESRGKTNCKMY
jgi:hypothetical protein